MGSITSLKSIIRPNLRAPVTSQYFTKMMQFCSLEILNSFHPSTIKARFSLFSNDANKNGALLQRTLGGQLPIKMIYYGLRDQQG